ncbi:MAG TPA: PilN domain-containing protein [Caulobacteraceae bacterium]
MNLRDLLNSEMSLRSIVTMARQGLRWWIDELAALLPMAWRASLSSSPRTMAEHAPDGGWRFWHDGLPLEAARPPRSAKGVVGLLLPPDAVLVRELTAPRMPAADVRRMLSLDIDRLSPLGPDLIHSDSEVIDRDLAGGKQSVLLGIVPRAAASRLVQAARADGLLPASLGVILDGESRRPHFNFLPAVREAAGEPTGGGARPYLWGAVAALMMLNLAVLVGRDMTDVSRLRRVVEAQRPTVNAVMRMRRQIQSEEERRRDLVARGARTEPLRMLNAVTQAVPSGAWVQHLEWNGQALRLVGFKAAGLDMAAAIRGSGAFTNPRSLTTDSAPRTLGGQPFDITADARARPRR